MNYFDMTNKTKMYDKVRKAWRRKTIKIRPDLKSMLLEREAESFALFLSDVIKQTLINFINFPWC